MQVGKASEYSLAVPRKKHESISYHNTYFKLLMEHNRLKIYSNALCNEQCNLKNKKRLEPIFKIF